ncbi:MAG: protein kinase, partial [Gemmatimonadales bacterium]
MPDLLDQLKTALADRYAIEREIGAGGMATVYLARDVKHQRQVAVKVLRPELAAAVGSERFLREITTTAQLNHPHILPLHDSGEADGFLFYVMPYVEGESLRDRLNRETQLPIDDALEIAKEVADALGYAHGRDVVHRDIKPENILLSGGHAVVADFGIARAISEAGGEKLTETGLAVGTPAYMSPEQGLGSGELDGRSDTYSLGCVLYEMLSGEPPYTGPTAQVIIAKHSGAPVPAVRTVRDTVPVGIDAALTKALAKAPADRYVTASQLVDALTGSAATLAPQAAARSTPRRWAMYAGALVVALLGGLWLVFGTLGPGASNAEIPRLVVLPFDNLGAPEDEYFAAGITEAITTRLAGIGGLGIISRQSAIQYKNSGKNAQQIAEELSVQYILEGTIQRERPGDPTSQVRVNPQLIRASDDTHLWASPYDVAMIEVFQVYGQIAEEVAREVNVRISTVERGRLGARSTESGPAYELYLRATQLRFSADRRENTAAAELLKQALALDPGFAVATAQLSRVYTNRSYNFGESRRWADSGLALARRAIDEDPSLASGYRALGLSYVDMGRLTEAAAAFREALEVQPSDGQARLV